jgi:hypothetical protein
MVSDVRCIKGPLPAGLRPGIGGVVVIHVAEQQAARRAVDDQPQILVDAHRPEVPVPRPVQLVEVHSRAAGVQLEIKGRGLDGFLLLTRQPGEAVGEGVGNAEVRGWRSDRVSAFRLDS